jgi:3',5'-cyclic AMP phosphodiesterase CpdA
MPFLKPMHRIAIISDPHANLPALKAVLEDLDKKHPDAVFYLGDLVDFAPWPNEVIETIRQRRIPTLMGNHDERIAFDHAIVPLEKHTEQERAAQVGAIEDTRRTISADNREFLSGLPREMRISYGTGSNAKKILLVHASARSIAQRATLACPYYDQIAVPELCKQLGITFLAAQGVPNPDTRMPLRQSESSAVYAHCGERAGVGGRRYVLTISSEACLGLHHTQGTRLHTRRRPVRSYWRGIRDRADLCRSIAGNDARWSIFHDSYACCGCQS